MTASGSEITASAIPSCAREVVLRAEELQKAFGGQIVLGKVDLELRRGEVVLLRGENGSGKTTLLNILTGNLEPDAGKIHYLADDSPRTYRFPRRWWQELNPWDHFRPEFVAQEGIGRSWQDVRLFGSLSIRDNIAVAEPRHFGENPVVALCAPSLAAAQEARIQKDATAALAEFGLAGREASSGDMVSLGQSKRVAIARAVAAGARVLFLDEPLAGLDRQGIADVLAVLKKLVAERDLTLVIVEHIFNQPRLEGLITTDWLLEHGKILCSEISSAKKDFPGITIQNLPSVAGPKRPEWFPLLAGESSEVTDEPLPRGAFLTRIRPSPAPAPSEAALEIQNLVVRRGSREVLGHNNESDGGGFNLLIHKGEIAILQAPNGWGKSTLFDVICGHLVPTAGSLRMNGKDITRLAAWDRSRQSLTALPANGASFPSLSVSDAAKLSSASALAWPDALATRRMSSLSGGEQRHTLLELAYLNARHSPGLVILDEPFAMLDIAATRKAIEKFRGLSQSLVILVPTVPE